MGGNHFGSRCSEDGDCGSSVGNHDDFEEQEGPELFVDKTAQALATQFVKERAVNDLGKTKHGENYAKNPGKTKHGKGSWINNTVLLKLVSVLPHHFATAVVAVNLRSNGQSQEEAERQRDAENAG